MKREIKFIPYPMREGTESSLEIWFQVIGELGVTEFQLSTNWYTDGVVEMRYQELKKDIWINKEDFLIKHFYLEPQPLDVCYFSQKRISEDDSMFEDGASRHVPHLGKPVFYGYKYKENTENEEQSIKFAYEKLLRGGEDALYTYLEDYYLEVFGELR
jgi:hypothetical protein